MLERHGKRGTFQKFIVAASQLVTPRHECIQACHLADAESRLHIGHAVVVAKRDLLVIPGAVRGVRHLGLVARDTVRASLLHGLRQIAPARDTHAPFGSRDDLDRMEAEDSDISKVAASDRFAKIAATDGMRGILDDGKAVYVAQRADCPHIA